MKPRRPQGLGPEPSPTMLRWIELRSQVVSCAVLLWAVQVLFMSSLIVIVVLPGGRKMAGQSDQSRQAEKGRAEDGRKHHLSPVHVNLLLDHDPIGLQQREGNQADDCGCCDKKRIADFPT